MGLFLYMRMKHCLFLSCVIATIGPAVGQTRPPAQTAAASANNCAPMRHDAPRSTIAPESSTAAAQAEPLGEKLAKSDGVLCPPSGVDPEIRAPTPDVGNTPVIPPPGSPGGDPNIRPK